MEAFAGSQNLQCEPSVPVEGQCVSQTVEYLPSVINENKTVNSHELTLSLYDSNVVAVDIVNLRSDELVDVPVAVSESHQKPSMGNNIHQDIQSSNKTIGLPRSWEDGYNWRKYGQKHIKGNEFPRSYYKCSHPNCQVKKQVEQSQDGGITDVIYRGKHDHSKPQFINQMASGTISSVQGERLNGSSSFKSTEDKSPNASSLTSHNAKANGAPEISKHDESPDLAVVVTSDNNVGDGVQLRRNRDETLDENDTESKRRCLNFSTEMVCYSVANHEQHMESLQAHQSQSQAFASASSNENVTATETSHQMAPSTTAPPIAMAASKALVPIGVDFSASQQRHGADVGVQAIQTDHKVMCPSGTTDRFWGDGYNWRKYGQKHIKGSEFPRSYYRCTHPKCQVKKQMECSQDGQITDVVYKGEHNHLKPQASSHIAVGRILSIQEEGFEQVSSLHQTYDKSMTCHPTNPTEINGNCEPVQACETPVQGELSKSNRTDGNADNITEEDRKCGHLRVIKETSKDAVTAINHQQCNPSVEFQGQIQSDTSLSSPLIKTKETAGSPHESTPTLTVSNSPVYMVTSKGIVPIEVDTDDKRQRHSSGNELAAEESDQNELSLSMTERLLENAYHWRKYGQKNIKGSEFPRSYYRCTHPSCQVKMQLERSHDGRIIEIIYKGKHDHPKPQPITRMAIGAILSLEEDRSDRISDGASDNPSNGPIRTWTCTNPTRIPKLTPVTRSVENVETTAEKLNQNVNEVEDDVDMESKRRKKDMGDVDLTPVLRTPREPRVVVETLSEVDVVDDGYRWQKYGRKIVKGNSNPRNYYRCSIGGCQVKKHVERAANNPKAVITTYEGKHNHDLPPGRITTHDTTGLVSSTGGLNGTLKTISGEPIANGIDVGNVNSLSLGNSICERKEIIDVEPIPSQSNISDLDRNKMIEPVSGSAHNDELNVGVDQDTLIELIANGIDSGVVNSLSLENSICERDEIFDVESIPSQSNISDLDRNKMIELVSVSAHNDELNVGVNQDTLIELITNDIDAGIVNSLSVENSICERDEIFDVEPMLSQSDISDLDRNKMIEPVSVSAHNNELNGGADQDTLIEGSKGLSCDTPSLTHLVYSDYTEEMDLSE